MFSTVLSGTVYGIEGNLIQVEVDLSSGLPCFVMVGSLSGEVKESGERVRVALKNMGIHLPPMHVAVNLSPADLRKEGTGFDLPIAIGVLTAMEKIPLRSAEGMLVLGELGLNGEIRPVKGVLPIATGAFKGGVRKCIVPKENAKEASIAGLRAAGVLHLKQVIDYLKLPEKERDAELPPKMADLNWPFKEPSQKSFYKVDFSEIVGQEGVKRAALIAAAGFHHLLIKGPPGGGKTMIAKRIPTILPDLSLEENLEVSSIYSIAGKLPKGSCLLKERPFLSPHHTITPQALSGGGKIPRPGIISLAHRGVLFLDELPEFKRQTIDLLRQPLEERVIQIDRSGGSFTFPADMMLVGAMNPCPCGYYPDRGRCRCTPFEIHNYLSHISGPILDRIDLCVDAPRVEIGQLREGQKGESSKSMRKKVIIARNRQQERYQGTPIRFNSELTAGEMEQYCGLGEKEKEILEKLFASFHLSVRAYHKLLRVARTIADLEESKQVLAKHLQEAACYQIRDFI